MAKEYIEREAANKAIELLRQELEIDDADAAYNDALIDCRYYIAHIPAADVVPVRRGKWVEVEVKELAYYKMVIASMRCDQCGRYHNEVYHYGDPTEMAKYCGFCGARMDLKDGDGE